MKKFTLIPVLLLIASLVVLLVMFLIRGLQTNQQQAEINLTSTAAWATQFAMQTEAARPTNTSIPTQTATPEPTFTPVPPTETSTEIPAISTPDLIPGCDVAAFIDDVTIPDGTEFDPDTKFTKTWRLLNNGTCTWNSFYKIYFVSGDKMSGPSSKPLTPLEVPPGKAIEVSVELRAPKKAGTYRGYWGFKNTNGAAFGIGPQNDPVYVEIKVAD